jgi:hypothetical protein
MKAMQQAMLGLRLAGLIFGLVSLAHYARFLARWEIWIDRYEVGIDASLVAGTVTAGLAFWLWKLAADLARPPGPTAPLPPKE